MRSEHRDEFLTAMGKEITELESHGTWTVIKKETMPTGANLLPSTWALKIKRYPDGQKLKSKARFCMRGDKQIAGVDYFESYAPVASWTTILMVMNLAVQRGWATRQVDFSNAFVQAELTEEVHVDLPEMFRDEQNHGSKDGVVLKLNKLLYGLVQAPLSWYNHLQKGLQELDFKVSKLDPGMYFGWGIIPITYVDDTLFFGPDVKEIEKVISELEGLGYGLTCEEGDETTAFAFLGVSILLDPVTKMLKMTQGGLSKKVLGATGMSECNTRG
jgi:histone deacetylase 1/2